MLKNRNSVFLKNDSDFKKLSENSRIQDLFGTQNSTNLLI